MPASARFKVSNRAATRADPASAWFETGNTHLANGERDAAIAAYDKALQLRPAFPEALRAGGVILRDSGSNDAALDFFGEALRLRPDYVDAVLDKGNLLHALGRSEEAVATFDATLAVCPVDAGLLTNKGVVLHSLGRLDEACAALEAAIAADPTIPNAHNNYAGYLMRVFRHADALPVLDRALALKPDYPAAHANHGLTLKMLGRFAEAAEAFDRALALEPGNAYALTNRGELRLLLGDQARGWIDYQSRFVTQWHNWPLLQSPVPLWSGEPLAGLRVLAITDAGNGDIIHFARYVPLLVAAGADVTVVCRPRLQRLLAPLLAGTRVVTDVDDDQRFDCLVPFSNLPFVLAKPVATMPDTEPYLLAEPERVAAWRSKLGTEDFKVGLCWRGSQDWRADPYRSIPLAAFAPLAALPGVRLISLQMDAETGAAFPLEHLEGVDAGTDSFIDTAAIMANLDLVVTIDTSIAHLAGALARPTAVLLRKVPEWRWLLGRDETPWYPTARLYRQEAAFDWDAPIACLVAEVAARLRGEG